jgi:hypothetical protein
MKFQKAILAFSLAFLLSGCIPFIKPDTAYLISKDKTWIILRDTPFQAISDDDKEARTYKIDADLLVIHKGRYLELEQEANGRVLKAKKEGNNKAAIFTGVGTLVGAAVAAYLIIKRKKK